MSLALLQTPASAASYVPPKEQREVKGLRWAEFREQGPFSKSRPRRSALKKGLSYERTVGRLLGRMIKSGELEGELVLGQWIIFSDREGVNWAQPDAYIVTPDLVLLMECKLTQTDTALPQLLRLYRPLLALLYRPRRVVCLQVCKNLRYIPRKIIEHPKELIDDPRSGMWTWHHIGV